jgi:glycosyltransferase involved in cell wall biosynthesis
MQPIKLTVLIPTFNNEKTISAVLTDVQWADEIFVVDSFSTDRTVEICQQFGARIIQHPFANPGNQQNWAIPQVTHQWIFLIDTDERLPIELQEEIQSLLREGIPPEVEAYCVARKTIILGEWLKVMNLYPDYQVRLFQRDIARYDDKEIHSHVIIQQGKLATFKNPLVHYSTPTISKQLGALDRYSSYVANDYAKAGKRFRWRDLLLRPILAFGYYYIYKGGFRAGFRGLFLSFYMMTFVFFTYAKLWEKKWQAKQNLPQP